MLEKGKLSGLQMVCIFYGSVVSTYWLTMPAITDAIVGRDSWMTPIFSSLIGLLIVVVISALHQRYPEQTPIEYMPRIIGLVPGTIAGIGLLLYMIHISSVVSSEYVDLIHAKYLVRTPSVVILVPLLLLSGYVVRLGIEVLARFAYITIFYWVIIFMIYVFLTIPDMDIHFLLPVMENGFVPQLKGILLTHGWSTQAVLIAFMLPYLNKGTRKNMSWSFVAVAFVAFDLVAAIIVPKLVFGTIMPDISYPVLQATEYIKIAEFFERIDLILMADWIILIFVKVAFYIYVISLGTAQLLRLSDYRPIVYPVCLLVLVISVWSKLTFSEITFFLQAVYPYYSIIFHEALPILLLLVAWIRGKAIANR